jgi:hypothetical protein
MSSLAVRAARKAAAEAAERAAAKAAREAGSLTVAPRRRVKPVIRRDNPGGEWLKHERRRAEENYSDFSRLPGSETASTRKPIMLDPQKLATIPGAAGEVRVPGDPQYDRLYPSMKEHGFVEPELNEILVGINHLGDPYIIEGNTRAAVARDLGIDRIPAMVRYYAGGEGVEGLMMPNRLEEFMPPSELALDPNFRRWFEGSKLRDEYGEPMTMYHATPEDFSVFKPGGVDPEISGHATWLSPYAEYQPAFHRVGARGGGFREGANVMPVYANMRNPLVLDDPGMTSWARDVFAEGSRSFPQLLPKNWLDNIRSEGYDGVIYKPAPLKTVEGDEILSDEYIVFDPTQIKSAIGNRGTYDPNDPDIRKARGGLAVKRKKK